MLNSASSWPQRFTVAPEQSGRRLDLFLADELPQFSRAALQRAIDAGHVRVDEAACKASLRLRAGSHVVVDQIAVPRKGPPRRISHLRFFMKTTPSSWSISRPA